MANSVKLSLSETDSQTSNNPAIPKDDICRDFLRNVCHRGSGCKYRHPEQNEAVSLGKNESVEFCHDYQNGQCLRRNCKFIHCTKDEEEYYRSSGHLSNQTPICKDFLNGKCRRLSRCKFQHIPPAGPQPDASYENNAPPPPPPPLPPPPPPPPHPQYNRYDDSMEPHVKRRALNVNPYMNQYNSYVERPQVMPEYYVRLEEENHMLANKVEQLQKQVADLTSTNEFLLEQNAKLRATKPNVVPNVQCPTWPPSEPKPINNLPMNGLNAPNVYTWG